MRLLLGVLVAVLDCGVVLFSIVIVLDVAASAQRLAAAFRAARHIPMGLRQEEWGYSPGALRLWITGLFLASVTLPASWLGQAVAPQSQVASLVVGASPFVGLMAYFVAGSAVSLGHGLQAGRALRDGGWFRITAALWFVYVLVLVVASRATGLI